VSWSSLVPRYFFHSQTATRVTDDVGVELEGPVEARREAIRTCGEMIRDAPEGFWGSRPWSVVVTNVAGLVLWEVFMDGIASVAD
jgi:hypothetical protein